MSIHKNLSFSQRRPDGTYDAWCVEATGNYSIDCQTGHNLYAEARFLCLQNKDLTGLNHVLHAMIEKGRVSGVEIGFIAAMTENIGV